MAGNNGRDPYADEIASAKALMAEKQYDEQPWSDWAGDAVGNALNTAKAILPTALGGEGSVGISDIARGAYEGAKEAVTFPGDVISGKQPLYDESGRPLESAVGRSFNTAATLGSAASVVPRPSNSLGVFGGIKSRTADKNALTQAQIMESQGASPEEIRGATGWNRGTDEQWRYEIPDVGTTVDPSKFQLDLSHPTSPSPSKAKLGDYLNHPDFFAAYPEMKNMEVRIEPGTILGGEYWGYYMPRHESAGGIREPYIGLNQTFLNTPELQRSTLLHEIQHAIQQKEGFMRGANKAMFAPDTIPDPRVRIYNEAVLNDPEMKEYNSIANSQAFKNQIADANKFYKENYDPLFKALNKKEEETGESLHGEWSKLSDEYQKKVHEMYPLMKRRSDLADALSQRGIPLFKPMKEFLTPAKAYEQTAGEVESRNVQRRMNMPKEELAKTMPSSTEDILRNEQLVDWNNTSWRKGYAGRGRVAKGGGGKTIQEALRIAQEGIEALTRGSGKTPKEVLSGFANQKPRVPFEEWRYEFEPTTELLPTKEFDPSQFRPGDVMIPLVGDRTSTGRKITSVAGEKLETPALTEGGPDYMRGPSQQADKSVWASGKGVITGLDKRIQNALRASEAQGYKDPNVYGTYVAMGPQSGDFSTHTAETVMNMMPNTKIKRADIKEFDDVMREKFPDWPGLSSPKAADYVVNAGAGEHRKTFLDVMDTAYWRDKGFPDVSLARYVTTTPELVTAPTEAAGYNIARITPGVKPDIITQPHRSYPSTMHGEYVGGLPSGLSRDELFTQFSRGFDADAPARNYVMAKRRSFGMDPNAFQVMDNPEIEALIRKTEALKRGYADGGEVDNALRVARDVGGATNENPQVFLTDAKGRQYDAQGNLVQPTATQAQSNSAATQAAPTPEQVGRRAAEDPATFDAMMQKYAIPDRDVAEYEALQTAVREQPQEVQQMTHVGAPPMRDVKVDMPLFGGEYSVGQAPYNVAGPMSTAAQAAYDLKTVPLYFTPWTAPIGAGLDVAEGVATGDPTTASLAIAFGPGGKMAKAAGIGAANYFIDPSEAEAGPARWFSKAMEVASAIPMNKMTGEQALAMLRKGTSPEELRWTGADTFLQNKPTVTKDELVDYLNKNRVQLNEVRLGGEKPKPINYLYEVDRDILDRYEPQFQEAEAAHKAAIDKFYPALGTENEEIAWKAVQDAKRAETELQMAAMQEMKDRLGTYRPVQFGPGSQHDETLTTPGGKNYRENLYQIPQRDIYTPYVEKMKKDFWQDTYNEAVNEGFTPDRAKKFADSFVDNSSNAQMAKALGREDEFTQMFNKQKELERYVYKGGHWQGTPDVLFHTRTNELIYEPTGANRPYRVHNVEETQSDLGQAARGKGFYDPEEARKWEADMVSARKARDDAMDNLGKELERFDEKFIADNGPEPREGRIDWNNWHIARQDAMDADEGIRAVRQQMDEASNRYEEFDVNRAPVRGKYARKPFVTSTEGWTDRAIKQELDKALDSGSDYFSWTPGAAHVERYDLSRHIGKVHYNPDDGSLVAYAPDGKMVVNESVNDPDDLDEYLGKELGDKIRAEAVSRRSGIEDAMSIAPIEDGEWGVFMNGEPMYEYGGRPLSFGSKGEANDYLKEQIANDFAETPVTLQGLDLKVGGEGMIGYYDKIYLKRVQDVLKKATGTKPEIEVIEVQTSAGPRKQLGVKLTDEMREKARFSDFNKGGRVTGGNAYGNDPLVSNALALTSEY